MASAGEFISTSAAVAPPPVMMAYESPPAPPPPAPPALPVPPAPPAAPPDAVMLSRGMFPMHRSPWQVDDVQVAPLPAAPLLPPVPPPPAPPAPPSPP